MNRGASLPTGAREVALAVVRDVFGPLAWGAQASFDVRARRARLSVRERSFAAELAYGAIKARRTLDWQLAPYIGSRPKRLDPTVAEILRLGVFQLCWMGGVENYAAVSQSVGLAWRHGHRGTAALVNAVLRRMQADGARRPERGEFSSDVEFFGTAYSVPTWLVERYADALNARGVSESSGMLQAVLAGINAPPRAALRVNTLMIAADEAAKLLTAEGTVTHPSRLVGETLIVDEGVAADDPDGRWSVQSEGAAIAVDLLSPQPGETVLDLCSGRGNKTAQIAARMRNRGVVICVERDPKKVRGLERTLSRAGVTNAKPVAGDALDATLLRKALDRASRAPGEARAHAVLVDAPCSGIGVIGRHPESRWRKSATDAERLAPVQLALLRAGAGRTAPSGRLVYSVCSIDPCEGRNVVDAFLESEPAFARAPLPERYTAFAHDGDVSTVPGIEGRDGFYIALLARGP